MATDYTTQAAIRGDSTYRSRLAQAVQSAALAISGNPGGANATDDALREALAHRMLSGGANAAAGFEQPVIAYMGDSANMDLTMASQSDATDANLDTAVAAVWSDVAGYGTTI